jgi:hypothetical protein
MPISDEAGMERSHGESDQAASSSLRSASIASSIWLSFGHCPKGSLKPSMRYDAIRRIVRPPHCSFVVCSWLPWSIRLSGLLPEGSILSTSCADSGSGLASQALLEHTVLFLEILDHVQLTAVDPATLVLGSEAVRSRLRAIGYRSITFSPD